ncbi:MAG: hypothetical protein QY321_00695 [Patescibacteria group bacterium]|nr:MAG: hypothetical protein QY321_00695 [Patescibacteria group bacterium]
MATKKILAIFFSIVFLLPLSVIYAQKVGVGVSTGTIRITEELRPGDIYQLPPMTVVNTGEAGASYTVWPGFRAEQAELSFDPEWLQLSPETFYLEPNKTQKVDIVLKLPLRDVEPGEYFSLLTAKPIKTDSPGAQIGVAAATKLYFTVKPSNILQAIFYRSGVLWRMIYPWNYIILSLLVLGALYYFSKKFIVFDIAIKKKGDKNSSSTIAGSKRNKKDSKSKDSIKQEEISEESGDEHSEEKLNVKKTASKKKKKRVIKEKNLD